MNPPLLAAVPTDPALLWALGVAGAGLVIAMIGALVRILRGPSLPDRVVALDLMGSAAIGVICVAAIATARPVLLSVALVMAVVLFVGTVAFSLFMQRRSRS